MQEEAVARPYYKVLADHYASVRDLANAKKSVHPVRVCVCVCMCVCLCLSVCVSVCACV